MIMHEFWNYGENYHKHREKIKLFAEQHGFVLSGHSSVIITDHYPEGQHFVVDLSATDPEKFMVQCVREIYKKGLETGTENTKKLLRDFLGVEDRLKRIEDATEHLHY
jgi:uncharacterized protein (DUF2249 family)